MPRDRGVRRGRALPPIQGRVLRGRVVEQEEPLNRPVDVDRRRRRGVDEHAQPPPKQMKSSGVQTVIT